MRHRLLRVIKSLSVYEIEHSDLCSMNFYQRPSSAFVSQEKALTKRGALLKQTKSKTCDSTLINDTLDFGPSQL